MTLETLVQSAFERGGFEGLFNTTGGCACLAGDLAPCGYPSLSCRPGVRAPCDCGQGCGFHVVAKDADETA